MSTKLVTTKLRKKISSNEVIEKKFQEIRSSILASISPAEKKKLLRGMVLTRTTDNALKHLFLSGEITYESKGFQGKGFRSLGQEAIYGATSLLHVGKSYVSEGIYHGDVAAPLIRDLGVFLAMSENDVATAINAQAGKSGNPCDGRDLHLGDFTLGLITPAAPLAIATCTLVGIALSFKKKQEARVAISFIGEGGSSLGEWHEAINFAAVQRLPMIFCIENNQTALSTPVKEQSRVVSFADKGVGYGINALTVDGNDVLALAAAFKFAADEARFGQGPMLLEIVSMRMCGHAHHDDMLYLGTDPPLNLSISPLKAGGYADVNLYEKWRALDPIELFSAKLKREGILSDRDEKNIIDEARDIVNDAIRQIKARAWSRLNKSDEDLVFKAPWIFTKKITHQIPTYTKDGITYLQAIALGARRAFHAHKNCLMIGEDIGPPYGNAFMMFKDMMSDFGDRFINTPISENAIVGASVGMAMSGMRPIGEIQFNDFIACAMDQVVNNVAKTYFRLNLNLPLVLRLPYGGLRRAGPYHSQDTSPWFYRTPGLKIMAPATPMDAMHMLMKAVDDPDPVLFYEHIALYRDPRIKQKERDINVDGAQVLREGKDLSLISYGAYSHVAFRVAELLKEKYEADCEVIDLRYLMPVDFATIYATVKKTSRVLLLGEDMKRGGILESIAATIGQELFSYLDAPVTVIGSRDTPVPYAPSLEDDYLLSEEKIISHALTVLDY